MNPIPIYDATAPIVCSITSQEVPARIDQVERLRANLDRLERTPHGLLLHFPARADLESDLRRFSVDEKRCCDFWGFAIETEGDHLTLRWDGPPAVEELLDRLAEFFRGDEPLTAIRGLL